jgi:alpha/beta superfamily hydrolase
MNAATQNMQLQGPSGLLELLCDVPEGGAFRGTVVIAHPHPLFGGTMQNKVVQTLAKAFVQNGWRAIRFNFRGVGESEGAYDEGRGEVDDLMSVIDANCKMLQPMALAGFSFGAYVTSQALARLSPSHKLEKLVFVGTAVSRFQVASVPSDLHDKTLVLHGEVDDTVPLASVLDWARPQSLPVTVIPGVEHFFHGQLPLLRTLISRHLRT